MKRFSLPILISAAFLIAFGCSTAPESTAENTAAAAVERFSRGLEGQNIDLLMSAYHGDAEFLFRAPDGKEDHLAGYDAIRAGQELGFKGPAADVLLEDAVYRKEGDVYHYELIVGYGDGAPMLLNKLELSVREGRWGIGRQEVEMKF